MKDPQDEWGEYVLYRTDIPERLPGILERKRTWKETDGGCGIVGLSFNTDCYMDPLAGWITKEAVDALVSAGKHARILTRNPQLASQHLDFYRSCGENVIIGSSINSLDAGHVGALEPNSPLPQQRISGLETFSDAGVPTYVSMGPTYPTMDKDDIYELMAALAELSPRVIFHEVINPRGSNFEKTIQASWGVGEDKLGSELAKLREKSTWIDYAMDHHRWVQEVGEELDLPVHIWPDKMLLNDVSGDRAKWLQSWFDRQSPEEFAGRDTPDDDPPALP